MSRQPEIRKPEKQIENEIVYHPMAVAEPVKDEKVEAILLRLNEVEAWISQHNKYHFGGLYK